MDPRQPLRLLIRPPEALMFLNSLVTRVQSETDYYAGGTSVLTEDWDTLILLDCCRYDTFERHHQLPGELESRISRGGGTIEFLRGNFRNQTLHDTVYVTANPQIIRLEDELNVEFHDIVNVWESGWDDDIQNVPPDVMAAAAEAAIEEYPNKRLIFHFNQPHGPFLGETAQQSVIGPNRPDDESLLDFIIYEIRHEFVSSETWRTGLKETFEIVHPYIEQLLESLDGRTVVSADHGEMVGERGSPIPVRYRGHHIGAHNEALLKVPWLIHESGSRRDITAETSPESHRPTATDDAVSERLRDLGYV